MQHHEYKNVPDLLVFKPFFVEKTFLNLVYFNGAKSNLFKRSQNHEISDTFAVLKLQYIMYLQFLSCLSGQDNHEKLQL